jgi:hypothetical protein
MFFDLPPADLLLSKPALIRPAEHKLLRPGYLPATRTERRAALKELVAKKVITPEQAKNAFVILAPAVGWSKGITVDYRNTYSSTANLTTYDFLSSDIGPAGSDKIVVVMVFASGNNTNTPINSATIAGVAATVAHTSRLSGNTLISGCVYASVSSGNAETISITMSAGKLRMAISVWALFGANPTHTGTDGTTTFDSGGISDVQLTALTIPADGVGFAMAGSGATSSSFTWSGANERSDATLEAAATYSGADIDVDGTNTITASHGGSTSVTIAGVAFAPA